MIGLEQILNSHSDLLKGRRVKIIRHKDSRKEYQGITDYRGIINNNENSQSLIEYQREQPRDVFKGCDYIVTFIGLERKKSLLFSVFRVNGVHKNLENNKFRYDLEPVLDFESLKYRLVIEWKSPRAWHQWLHSRDIEVTEILPKGYIGSFPGLLNFVLDFGELQTLVNNSDANFEWKNHLSSVNGIYLILDNSTGNQYIGSANGKEGIWQRWSEYSKNFTGGNKELIQLMDNDPEHYCNFKYSILQTLPSNITQKEIIAIENLYKEKLGSKSFGLNLN